jgi:transposase
MSRDPRSAGELLFMSESEKTPTKRPVGRSTPYRWRVSDRLWHLLEPLLEDPPRRFRYPGRCRYPARSCLEGILYVLYTDTPWLEVPYRELGLPSGETCRRRLEEWTRRGLLEEAITILQSNLYDGGRIDWSRVIVDASLVEAKKGARRSRAHSWASREAAFTSQ